MHILQEMLELQKNKNKIKRVINTKIYRNVHFLSSSVSFDSVGERSVEKKSLISHFVYWQVNEFCTYWMMFLHQLVGQVLQYFLGKV